MRENLQPMKAMVLRRPGEPLHLEWRPLPPAGPGEIRVRVEACAVCRTDLHVVDGDLPDPRLPLVPGHEIVGMVESQGDAPGFTGYTQDGGFAVAWEVTRRLSLTSTNWARTDTR